MQTNIELAGAGGQAIALPLSTQQKRRIAAVERPARPASLFSVVKEVKRAERFETLVWVGIAIAAVTLLVISFAMRQGPLPLIGG